MLLEAILCIYYKSTLHLARKDHNFFAKIILWGNYFVIILARMVLLCKVLRDNSVDHGNHLFCPMLRISTRASEPQKRKQFAPVSERGPESVQNRAFCTKRPQKVRFCTLCGALSDIDANPTFCALYQKNVRNPNHHYFSKKYCNTPPICITIRPQFVLQSPPICIAVRLPFVSQYASHLYCNTFGKILVVVVTGMFPTLVFSLLGLWGSNRNTQVQC